MGQKRLRIKIEISLNCLMKMESEKQLWKYRDWFLKVSGDGFVAVVVVVVVAVVLNFCMHGT